MLLSKDLQKPLTLLLGDAAWLLELANALDEAREDSEDETVHITADLAAQLSRHLRCIVSYATPTAN